MHIVPLHSLNKWGKQSCVRDTRGFCAVAIFVFCILVFLDGCPTNILSVFHFSFRMLLFLALLSDGARPLVLPLNCLLLLRQGFEVKLLQWEKEQIFEFLRKFAPLE